MDRFVYIHGFNSGKNSHSGQLLRVLLHADVLCPEYDYAYPFAECLRTLEEQIYASINVSRDRLCLMGSSLGGFYALQLRHSAIVHVCVWNPIVFPSLQMERFLGKNTRFSDNTEWEFGRDTLLSYAQAPDPRLWAGSAAQQEALLGTELARGQAVTLGIGNKSMQVGTDAYQQDELPPVPRRDIFLGDQDELLDGQLTRQYWQHSATLHTIHFGHQITDYRHAEALLREGMWIDTFADADWLPDNSNNAAVSGMAIHSLAAIIEESVATQQAFHATRTPYLRLSGTEQGKQKTYVIASYYPCEAVWMKRLFRSLALEAGSKNFILFSADGNALQYQIAPDSAFDTERPIPLNR
jgi:hypothetical protein